MGRADAGGGWKGVWLSIIVMLGGSGGAEGAGSCGLAELGCKDGHCVPLDAYCDGKDDCGDGSDEPALCTPCNRTYHGVEGRTYKLVLLRPVQVRLPFFCHLTFTAGGPGHGELVQLLWEEFKIGRLDPAAEDATGSCPEGSLQLAELGRPFTGGSWCGAGKGRASYYSETSTVTASVRLFHAPTSVPFEFSLRYRFVARSEAIARLGQPGLPFERGAPVPGTYCSRNFYECYRKRCRVQSPNYPGEYPRNATCLLNLRQKEVPTCKHAMMAVRPSAPGPAGLAASNATLAVWQDCPPERDRIVIRDGTGPDDPVLLTYCGGPLPRVTARGPTMLVEFRSSSLAIPLGASALRLELEAEVVFVDSDGLDYARGTQGCHFFVNGTAWRSGVLKAPLHSLPPGSSCTWNIQGLSGDRVWIYFSSYSQRDLTGNAESNVSARTDRPCAVKITLWDGTPSNGLPIVALCDEAPRLCAHAALRNATRATRPCTAEESYLTVAPTLTLKMESLPGTVLHTVNFQARYEFVATLQGGESWIEGACNRVWRKVRAGTITSPRDVRLFGRGGASRLECRYRVEGGPGERVRLTLHNASLGELTTCVSERDFHTGRPRCSPEVGSREAHLTLFEAPWRDFRLPRACLCDNTSHLPLTHISTSRALEITFLVDQQAPHEDFETVFFHASFELVRAPECPRKQRVRGEGGELRFVAPPLSRPDIYCEGLPWLVEARENRSLFLLTWGWFLPLDPNPANGQPVVSDAPRCPTSNRVLLYSGKPPKLLKVVCPAEPGAREYAVHVFSEEWLSVEGEGGVGRDAWLGPPKAPALLIDFVAREPGQAAASWLEISRSRSALRRQLRLPERGVENDTSATGDCPHRCPELGACIAASLWCDGRPHCPSGHDEEHCGNGARLLGMLPPAVWLFVAGTAGVVTAFACILAILIGPRNRREDSVTKDSTKERSRAEHQPKRPFWAQPPDNSSPVSWSTSTSTGRQQSRDTMLYFTVQVTNLTENTPSWCQDIGTVTGAYLCDTPPRSILGDF
ncbi:uncharacterized protein LOC124301420 isoform X1 [Neodiprion virginianus]|uniref:uncharacterized protein LOC124301420 isoform X1 n=2 Tax=Neodiprion virginianus TaxID=2961670 RepID=UPI001EE70AB7|nr:uncharacterized protein LOC124301420 isoform X1 [Neodiprion virginianus]